MKFTAIYIIGALALISCKKSKDSATITSQNPITAACSSKEDDVNITLNDAFDFIENYDFWNHDSYYDFTQIAGTGIIQPFGEFTIYVSKYSGTAAFSNTVLASYFLIVKGNIYIDGYSSIDFEKLIRQGGGSFNGTFTVAHGSADCAKSSPPLTVIGNLDLNAHMVGLTIKGKAYF